MNQNVDVAVTFRDRFAGYKIHQFSSRHSLIEFPKSEAIKNLFSDKITGSQLKFLARHEGQCVSQEVFIMQAPYIGHVFIQLDRSTYMPGDEVKFRVLAMDNHAKPIDINNIEVMVLDKNGREVFKFDEFSTENEQLFKTFGFYENSFTIDSWISDGTWQISAKIDDNENFYAEKLFEVSQEQSLMYEFRLDVPEEVNIEDEQITVEVSGRYKFGEFAKGYARLKFTNAKNGEELYIDYFMVDTKVRKTYNINEDLGIDFILGNSFNVAIKAEFCDDATGLPQTLEKQVKFVKIPSNLDQSQQTASPLVIHIENK